MVFVSTAIACAAAPIAESQAQSMQSPALSLCYTTAGSRRIDVNSGAQLAQALANAQPGDWIALAPGAYDGSFDLNASGQEGKPIVVSAAAGTATITGPFDVSGDFDVLANLSFTSAPVTLSGSRDRVTRSTFRGEGRYAIGVSGARYNRIDHNDVSVRGHGIQIRLSGKDPGLADTTGNRIDHNFIHDMTGNPENGNEGIQIGQSPNSANWQVRTLVDHNLLDRVEIDSEIISVKAGYNTIAYNTFLDSAAAVSNRQGSHNDYMFNYIEGVKKDMIVWGDDTRVFGNVFVRTNLDIMGGENVSENIGKGQFPLARRTMIAGNSFQDGKLNVGVLRPTRQWQGPQDTTLGDNRIDAQNVARLSGSGTTANAALKAPAGQAVKLSPADVGPGAKDADCP